jgi:hypothetical protein
VTSDEHQPPAPAPPHEHLDQQRRKAVEWAASRWPILTDEAKADIGDPARRHRRAASHGALTVPESDAQSLRASGAEHDDAAIWRARCRRFEAHLATLPLVLQPEYAGVTTPTGPVAERINAWLEGHRAWVDASPDRQRLAEQWRTCARLFGADSDPARGVLLGLVRLAWNDPYIVVTVGSGWSWRERPRCRTVDPKPYYPSEIEALLAALEAAPCL